jgi:voltage-gated potassium channel
MAKLIDRGSVRASAFTAVLFLLIMLATSRGGGGDLFGGVMLLTTLVAIFGFHRLFPERRFLTIALTNFLAVYACIFSFFIETNFPEITQWVLLLGFTLPIFSFLGGVWRQREAIGKVIVAEEHREIRHWGETFRWLVPVFTIGVLTFVLPDLVLTQTQYDLAYLAAMGAIALIVLFVSRDVCVFLVETSLLFELFFEGMRRLVIPAFAFFSFYSVIVIIFACVYRLVSTWGGAHFLVQGVERSISFSESLYFSIVTLSTVGYGDIVPLSGLVRVIISAEIIAGVLLMLFGFAEFISYGRDRLQRRGKE